MNGPITDITRPLSPATAVWPGDEPFSLRWTQPYGPGAAAVSCLRLSPHIGTHLDAPLHLDPSGADAASIPLVACVGPSEVLALPGHDRPITREDLPSRWSPSAPRVLFSTGTWPAGTLIPAAFASLSPALVEFLAGAGVVLVGIDTPSVDEPFATGLLAHRSCAAHGMVILEGLDLERVPAGIFTLVAVPLRLEGAEASPVRAFLVGEVG